ncbi:hypothetical protein, partial [Pseudomonas aeruginosa]|uniref:hypothetical protein n=1 Tax=Pseudomonas aeruginosa TaxID=287 RepID=UPI003D9C6C97
VVKYDESISNAEFQILRVSNFRSRKLDGLLPRLNPGQIWQHPHKTSATSFARSRLQQCGIARHGPDMSKCPSAR